VSQNFGSPREQDRSGRLQRRSTVSAWLIVGFAILAFGGLLAVRSAADTSADGTRFGNPAHNSQCFSSNRSATDSRCPKAAAVNEVESFIIP
jgi:hypothetical protein